MKTKLFTLFLALTTSVGIMHAFENVKIGDLYYNLNTTNFTAEVTNCGYGCLYALTSANIPSTVDYNNRTYCVTSIGSEAFDYCDDLLSVSIPNSVTSIGEKAFRKCYRLTSVTIPNSITSIGNYAFSSCTGLTSMIIPNSVSSIGDYAFSSCAGMTSVTIPNSVISIGRSAFSGCIGLTSVNIPNSVTSIGKDAFSGCSGLTSVHISDLSSWCATSFTNGSSNPLYHAHKLYLNGELITDLVIPENVESIGPNAFNSCTSLSAVTIPSSVVSIRKGAFQYCSGLTSITISNGLMAIGTDAFSGCIGLTSVHISDLSSWCTTSFTNESSNPLYHAHKLYLNGELITDLVIPENVESIAPNAFYGCTGLSSVTIPNSVTNIGNSAFQGCSHLMKITFGTAVETISNNAFKQCPYLLELHAPMECPPIIDVSVFAESGDLGGIDCYVSGESLALYKKVDVWKSFNLLIESASEAVENVATEQLQSSTKLLHEGQILILRGDKTYTMTGQEVR